MTLQQQVCTLDQAKRLKELGCEQGSLFAWYPYESFAGELWDVTQSTTSVLTKGFRAYTVAELGRMLPDRYSFQKTIDKYDKQNGNWVCIPQFMGGKRFYGETLAQAMADLLIHILEKEKAA